MRWPPFALGPAVDPAVIEALGNIPVTVLSDAMERQNLMARDVRHIAGPPVLVGRALPVSASPGDNLSVFQALEVARPGDVLVVSAGADAGRGFALVGEFVATDAGRRGLAGFVVDGSVRDAGDLHRAGIAIFATGVQGRGPARVSQGRIGWPVACGGVAVLAGDIVVGDVDGVAVVPAAVAAEVLADAARRLDGERTTRERLQTGERLGRILGITPYREAGGAGEGAGR